MKIIYRPEGILDAEESYIIHGCNAQGRMGSGVAKVLFDRYPNVRSNYLEAYKACKDKGVPFLGTCHYCINNPHVVVNAITQEFYGYDGKLYASYEAILDVFISLNDEAGVLNNKRDEIAGTMLGSLPPMPAVAMPLIGCGLAGGDWKVVRDIIELTATNYQPVVYLNGASAPI